MSSDVSSEKKASVLDHVSVRISPEEKNYVPLKNEEGWYVAVGKNRLPEIHKDIRQLLAASVRGGCALFATEGGLRVMRSANGKGGLFFIERKDATSGTQVFVFPPCNKEKAVKAGLTLTKEGNGVYVAPRMGNGELVFEVIRDTFMNNHGPMNFQIHEWPGMKVEMPEKKVKVAKVSKEEKSEKSQKNAVITAKTPEQQKKKISKEEKHAASA